MIVPDMLEMLVTGDPVAEIDAALARGASRLRAARARRDARCAERLLAWIDYRLDQRLDFRYPAGQAPPPWAPGRLDHGRARRTGHLPARTWARTWTRQSPTIAKGGQDSIRGRTGGITARGCPGWCTL
jgi:hypothetical protein